MLISFYGAANLLFNAGYKVVDWWGNVDFLEQKKPWQWSSSPWAGLAALAVLFCWMAWESNWFRQRFRSDTGGIAVPPVTKGALVPPVPAPPLRFEHDGVEWEDTDANSPTTASISGPYCPKCHSLLGYSLQEIPSYWEKLRDDHKVGGFDRGGMLLCPNWDFQVVPHFTMQSIAQLISRAEARAIGLKRTRRQR